MKTEEIKRWEIIESRGKRYLRDRMKNEGLLIEVHESQTVLEDGQFIIIYCFIRDFNLNLYSTLSVHDKQTGIYAYIFKKTGERVCYTLFQ